MTPRRVRASAPGSIGNVGPGLDVLGLAFDGPCDVVIAERVPHGGVEIVDAGHPSLPAAATANAAGIAAAAVLRAASASFGVRLRVEKGLPLSGGQGGSAASAVAAAVAVNALLDAPLSRDAVFSAALTAESKVAARHGDNVAPALLGGLVLVLALDPPDLIALPVPDTLRIVLAHPHQVLRTADARAALPGEVPLATVIHQLAQVAAFVAACTTGDLTLLGRALDDRIAEPARAPLLPGFLAAQRAARAAGALGGSISGGGPTAFALTAGDETAARVTATMRAAYDAAGVRCDVSMHRPDRRGTIVEVLE